MTTRHPPHLHSIGVSAEPRPTGPSRSRYGRVSSLGSGAAAGLALADMLPFIVLVSGSAFFAYAAAQILALPHALNYTEGISLLHAVRVLAGEPLYPDVNLEPYVYTTYPPVYPAVSAAIVALFGRDLFGMRLLAVACEIAAALGCNSLLRHGRVPRSARFATVGLLLAAFSVQKFHALARLDFLLLTLVVFSVEQFVGAARRADPRRCLRGATLAVFAVMTKATAVVPLAVVFSYACWRWSRQDAAWRSIALSLLGSAATVVLLYGILAWYTDGEFLRHTVYYQALSVEETNPWKASPFRRIFSLYWPIPALAASGLLFFRAPALPAILAAASFAWLCGAARKAGADLNYAIQPTFWCCWLIGLTWGRGKLRSWPNHIALVRTTLGTRFGLPLAIGAAVVFYLTTTHPGFHGVYLDHLASSREGRERIADYLRTIEGPILLEEPYLAALHGLPFLMSDTFQLLVLARQGEFDLEPLLEKLRSGEISYVLAGHRLLRDPRIGPLIRESYLPVTPGGEYRMDEATRLILARHRSVSPMATDE